MSDKKIKMSMLENADNFALEGIRCAISAEKQPEEWKFAILHIVQSIELVLKEILRREHQSLIYEDIDKQKNTVSLTHALARIPKVSEVIFDKSDIKEVEKAVKIRHRFTHYDVEYLPVQMKLTFAEMLGFLQHCYIHYFDRRLDKIVPKELWKNVINIKDYTKELFKRAQKIIDKDAIDEGDIFECPKCYKESFCLGKNECLTCGHKEDTEDCDKCSELIFLASDDYWRYDYGIICQKCVDKSDYDDYVYHLLR